MLTASFRSPFANCTASGLQTPSTNKPLLQFGSCKNLGLFVYQNTERIESGILLTSLTIFRALRGHKARVLPLRLITLEI